MLNKVPPHTNHYTPIPPQPSPSLDKQTGGSRKRVQFQSQFQSRGSIGVQLKKGTSTRKGHHTNEAPRTPPSASTPAPSPQHPFALPTARPTGRHLLAAHTTTPHRTAPHAAPTTTHDSPRTSRRASGRRDFFLLPFSRLFFLPFFPFHPFRLTILPSNDSPHDLYDTAIRSSCATGPRRVLHDYSVLGSIEHAGRTPRCVRANNIHTEQHTRTPNYHSSIYPSKPNYLINPSHLISSSYHGQHGASSRPPRRPHPTHSR